MTRRAVERSPAPLAAEAQPLRSVGAPAPEKMRVEMLHRTEDLAGHVAAWDDLAAAAIEPNVFYEPWFLLPALEHLEPIPEQRFVLVYGAGGKDGREVLCGFFPLQACRTETAVALPAMGLLRHPFCYLRTPLLRAGCAREALHAFLEWALHLRPRVRLFELGDIAGDGPFRQLLTDELYQRGTLTYHIGAHTRALFRPSADVETYLQAAMSSRHRRDFGRKERRLADHGPIRYEASHPDMDAEAFAETFLKLEAAGWKGRRGTALCSDGGSREMFRAIVRGAAARRRLLTLTLWVGDRAAAQRVSFLAGTGAVAFKIAYDESFSRYSPGVLLELENLRRLHASPALPWMDCGAVPYNSLFNQVWIHRRPIETLLLAGDSLLGGTLVSGLPLLRLANRVLRSRGLGLRARPEEAPQAELAQAPE